MWDRACCFFRKSARPTFLHGPNSTLKRQFGSVRRCHQYSEIDLNFGLATACFANGTTGLLKAFRRTFSPGVSRFMLRLNDGRITSALSR
jgi:hypothetical protein